MADGKPLRLSDLRTEKDWLRVRGREIAMVMQGPMTSLNPLKTIAAFFCNASIKSSLGVIRDAFTVPFEILVSPRSFAFEFNINNFICSCFSCLKSSI